MQEFRSRREECKCAECRNAGVLECRSAGVQKCWSAEMQECRSAIGQ
jgi:hypothetical protein